MSGSRLFLLMMLCAVVGAEEHAPSDRLGFWPGLGQFASDTWNDTVVMVTAPANWDGRDWTEFGIVAGAIGLTMLEVDQHVRIDSQEDRTAHSNTVSRYANSMGTVYSLGVLGASGLAGYVFDNSTAENVARDGLEATIIASGIFCPILKFAVGRSRPEDDTDAADDFRPFSGNYSFPSGHTTQAFAIASVVAAHYDDRWWIGATAFGLASVVGYARINDNQHFLTDVVAGAVLGTTVGLTVSDRRNAKRSWTMTPVVREEGSGIAVRWDF